jgi:hypothetical protein
MGSGDGFYLGGVIDPRTGKRTDEEVRYEPGDLTTHGVIVGMTGSGKTGLGIIFLEEALRAGLPALILDPKGDMTNLLLTFPDLSPADFRPWIDEAAAQRDGTTPDEAAAAVAASWASGLESWGLSGADLAALRAAAECTIYTPGSGAGIPLNVLGSLAAPSAGADTEAFRDEIEGLVSGLLGLVGIEADPLASREHILLANLIENAWARGIELTLEGLIEVVHRPPLRKLGVFELETFFPEKDRLALALRLNNLVASPSFTAWRSGPPLEIPSMLWTPEGKPRAAILYLAHLSDAERQFAVTLALSRLVTWMRSQPGSSELRALVYMDEVFGFVPPTAVPPAKKPILTILKQARAFGVGMLLSTQNPVDLDYKAMSNAGTWCIGRLQTERDKARIMEALQSASGGRDLAGLDATISGLGKRQFLLHNTRDPEPVVFTTRWALSYLRGPLTRDEVARLTADDPLRAAAAPATPAQAAAGPEAEHRVAAAPRVAPGTPVYYLDPAAAWAEQVGAGRGGTELEAALAVRVHLTFDDTAADLRQVEEWEAVFHPLEEHFDPAAAVAVDYDRRDFLTGAPAGASYGLPAAPLHTKTYFSGASRDLKEYLARERTVAVLRNRPLKLYSRVGEDREAFAARCRAAAETAGDAEAAKIRDRFEGRLDTLRRQIEDARFKVEQADLDSASRRSEEVASGLGTVIGVLLGGRRSTGSLGTIASKRSMTRKAQQRRAGAEARLTGKLEDLEELEDDLAEELADIRTAWAAKAAEIDELEIPLEKSDIVVDEVAVVWVPVA